MPRVAQTGKQLLDFSFEFEKFVRNRKATLKLLWNCSVSFGLQRVKFLQGFCDMIQKWKSVKNSWILFPFFFPEQWNAPRTKQNCSKTAPSDKMIHTPAPRKPKIIVKSWCTGAEESSRLVVEGPVEYGQIGAVLEVLEKCSGNAREVLEKCSGSAREVLEKCSGSAREPQVENALLGILVRRLAAWGCLVVGVSWKRSSRRRSAHINRQVSTEESLPAAAENVWSIRRLLRRTRVPLTWVMALAENCTSHFSNDFENRVRKTFVCVDGRYGGASPATTPLLFFCLSCVCPLWFQCWVNVLSRHMLEPKHRRSLSVLLCR